MHRSSRVSHKTKPAPGPSPLHDPCSEFRFARSANMADGDTLKRARIADGGDASADTAGPESPMARLQHIATESKLDMDSAAFAKALDTQDKLSALRAEFNFPKNGQLLEADASLVEPEADCVYLCGNSLGLEPKETKTLVVEELDKWARRGVIGHFDDSPRPWVSIDETVVAKSAKIVGALPHEVAIMNTLTVNLHLLMIAFYRPTFKRHKIIMEAKAFPSDFYAVTSQIKQRGFNPDESLVEVGPREGEETIREEDILAAIEEHGDTTALVMFSGVQFYNGQFFDLPAITAKGHAHGCMVGFDLAHAVGNVELKLHEWDVDFACWCTYKYLNSGPGGIAGAFVHDKHNEDTSLPRLTGWWGVDPATRFEMGYDSPLLPGVKGFQLSNPPVLQTVSLLGSLNVFEKTSMQELRAKSELLTAYLEYLLNSVVFSHDTKLARPLRIITPTNHARRGCQLSLLFPENVKPIFDELEKRGVVCDKREPNVLRVAPAPMYNSFADVYRFGQLLRDSVQAVHDATS
eukprot:m.482812 g.482812  ORF g.482812 m.482812 type:complete len:521 (+) comp22671_c0_seq1:159-1721(+)